MLSLSLNVMFFVHHLHFIEFVSYLYAYAFAEFELRIKCVFAIATQALIFLRFMSSALVEPSIWPIHKNRAFNGHAWYVLTLIYLIAMAQNEKNGFIYPLSTHKAYHRRWARRLIGRTLKIYIKTARSANRSTKRKWNAMCVMDFIPRHRKLTEKCDIFRE